MPNRSRWADMETYRVAVIDEHFISEDEFRAADEQAALATSIRSAIDIAAEQVSAGKPFFGAEVTLSRDAAVLSRMVVSVGASPLKTA